MALKEVITIIYDKEKITKEQISSLPFLKGFDIWDYSKREELVPLLKKAIEPKILPSVRPHILYEDKNKLFSQGSLSKNTYVVPEGSNDVVIFRFNPIESNAKYEITTFGLFEGMEMIKKLKDV